MGTVALILIAVFILLLAISFFSGHLMGRGGMARRLIDFSSTLVGFRSKPAS